MATVLSVPSIAVEDLPPIFTHASARALGISDRALYQWRNDGRIDQLARGIFAQADLPADPDLVEIAVRASDATLCLTTALAPPRTERRHPTDYRRRTPSPPTEPPH